MRKRHIPKLMPENPREGQRWFNTIDHKEYKFSAGKWLNVVTEEEYTPKRYLK